MLRQEPGIENKGSRRVLGDGKRKEEKTTELCGKGWGKDLPTSSLLPYFWYFGFKYPADIITGKSKQLTHGPLYLVPKGLWSALFGGVTLVPDAKTQGPCQQQQCFQADGDSMHCCLAAWPGVGWTKHPDCLWILACAGQVYPHHLGDA